MRERYPRRALRYAPLVKYVLILVAILATGLACRKPEFRVRVLYSSHNPGTEKLRQSEREFSFTDPRLNGGTPFVIAADTTNDAASFLLDKSKSAQSISIY